MSKMKRVLVRYYSANNLGDDLFVEILAKRYKNTFSIILHQNSRSLQQLDNVNAYKNKFMSVATYYLNKARSGSRAWAKLLILLIKRNDLMVYIGGSIALMQRLIKRNDLMVYIGGSIFMEYGNLDEWRLEELFYKKLKIPYYILGANFGPYKSPEFVGVVTNIIRGAGDACFRDKSSYEVFRKLPSVRVASDIVFSLDTTQYKIKSDRTVVFSIIECRNRFEDDAAERYERKIIELTKQFAERGYKVVYISFCKIQGDLKAAEHILSKIDTETATAVSIYSYEGDLDEALRIIASCSVVVGTRFHATILGLVFGKKVLPVVYSSKTTEVLNDIGFTGQTLDITAGADFQEIDIDGLKQFDVRKQTASAVEQFAGLDAVLVRKGSNG